MPSQTSATPVPPPPAPKLASPTLRPRASPPEPPPLVALLPPEAPPVSPDPAAPPLLAAWLRLSALEEHPSSASPVQRHKMQVSLSTLTPRRKAFPTINLAFARLFR